MSTATERGDSGQTSLARGIQVSRSLILVGSYGSADQLHGVMGMERSICRNEFSGKSTRTRQHTRFRAGTASYHR